MLLISNLFYQISKPHLKIAITPPYNHAILHYFIFSELFLSKNELFWETEDPGDRIRPFRHPRSQPELGIRQTSSGNLEPRQGNQFEYIALNKTIICKIILFFIYINFKLSWVWLLESIVSYLPPKFTDRTFYVLCMPRFCSRFVHLFLFNSFRFNWLSKRFQCATTTSSKTKKRWTKTVKIKIVFLIVR